jgi:hypothetical protein
MGNIDWAKKDAEEKTAREQLKELAPAVAALLPGAWTVKAHRTEESEPSGRLPHWYTLEGPDDASIDLNCGTFNATDRVSIGVNFLDRVDGYQFWSIPYKTERPRISVAIARGAHAVAKEIARRLLPEYMPLLLACNEARRKHLATQDARGTVARELAAYIGTTVHTVDPRHTTEQTVNVYRSTALSGEYFDLKVSGGYDGAAPSVEFNRVSVPAHVAKQILDILVANHNTKTEEE